VEQRHGQITGISRSEAETLRQHQTGERHLFVCAAHRLGITAGAGGEDQHEQVIGSECAELHGGSGELGQLGRELTGVDIDGVDAGRCGFTIFGVDEDHLTVGMLDIAKQCRTAAGGIQTDRHNAR
jgi:hypothetical protein